MTAPLAIRLAILALGFAAVAWLVMRPWFLGGGGGSSGNDGPQLPGIGLADPGNPFDGGGDGNR